MQRAIMRPRWTVHTRPKAVSSRTVARTLGLNASANKSDIDAAVNSSQAHPLAKAIRLADSKPVLKALSMPNVRSSLENA